MNWFMMTSTSASCHVGTADPATSKAVLSGGGTSEDDADATGTTRAITTTTATPIDSVIRVAACRLCAAALLLPRYIVDSPCAHRNVSAATGCGRSGGRASSALGSVRPFAAASNVSLGAAGYRKSAGAYSKQQECAESVAHAFAVAGANIVALVAHWRSTTSSS